MHLLLPFAVCVGLFLLFPKGFKYLVGTWVGAISGWFFWGLAGIASCATFVTIPMFIGFTIAGIFAGIVFAAKG
jgi:hypothetical protein